jgi:hypothetical protein
MTTPKLDTKLRPWTSALLAAALALSACSGSHGDDVDAGTSFLAFSQSFYGFHQWQLHYDVTADAAPGTVHPDAQLIEYLNAPPKHGSTVWPVGTIIVKEGTDGDPLTRQFFAMVKRGGDFNTAGISPAVGWEWFELQNQPDMESVTIVWRGFGPPLGEVYGGDPNAGCNSCHVACGNDAVCAPKVQLSQF